MHTTSLLTAESWVFAYLLNALWQVPLIFASAWLMARITRRAGPELEHRLWVGAVALEAILPACRMEIRETLAALRSALQWFLGGASSGGEVRILLGPAHARENGLLHLSPMLLTAVCALYACTILYFAGRLAWGLWQAHILTRNARPATLDSGMEALWSQLRRSSEAHGFSAEIAVSAAISGPITVGIGAGFRRMLLLLPCGLLPEAASADLAVVLAHEYAHMRRRDFTKNLLYTVLALPVAWHPLLWLTRRHIAESREMVCDAWAANALEGGERYARSLLRLAAALCAPQEEQTVHAIGIFDANNFERRIMNLTRKTTELRGLGRIAAIAACVLAAVVVSSSALALRMEPASAALADPPKRIHVKASDLQANLVSQEPPVYPKEAKEQRVQGAVVLDVVVNKEGVPETIKVISGPHQLQQSALDAVRRWRYKPFLLNGEPIEVDSTVTVTYSLSK